MGSFSEKLFLVLFLALIAALAYENGLVTKKLSGDLTALINGIVSLSVPESFNGIISSFTLPETAFVGNPVSANVSFKNVGNVNFSSQISIRIFQPNGELSGTFVDDNVTLNLRGTRSFSVSFRADTAGNHTVAVRADFSNKTVFQNGTVFVVAPPTPTPAPSPVSAPGGFFESRTVREIPKGETKEIVIQKADILKIEKITVELKETVKDAQIIVQEAEKPANIPPPIPEAKGVVNKYIEVTKVNIVDSQIASLKMRLKVEKSWIVENSIEDTTVSLYRLENANWNKLPTTMLNEDKDFIFYEATSPGLSIFSIAGEKTILRTEFQESIRVTRGQTAVLNIFVKNTGKENINSIVLTASSFSTVVEVTPQSISLLKPGESFVFILTVKIPEEIPLGSRVIDLTFRSDKITKSEKIEMSVETFSLAVEVDQLIQSFEISINKLLSDIERSSREGKNMTVALAAITGANSELKIAKDLASVRNYFAAKEHLNIAKEKIEIAAQELASAIAPPIIFVPIPFPRPELISVIGLGLGTSLFVYYRKKKEDEKYRKRIKKAINIIKSRGSREEK